MKKLFILIFLSIISLQVFANIYSYSIFIKRENKEITLFNISVIEGYTFKYSTNGIIESDFEITPVNTTKKVVTSKIKINSKTFLFENTVNSKLGEKKYLLKAKDLNNEKFEIYLIVNGIKNINFETKKEKNFNSIKYKSINNEVVFSTKLGKLYLNYSTLKTISIGFYYKNSLLKISSNGTEIKASIVDNTNIDNLKLNAEFYPIIYKDKKIMFAPEFNSKINYLIYDFLGIETNISMVDYNFTFSSGLFLNFNFNDIKVSSDLFYNILENKYSFEAKLEYIY
ncbi:hypothetical protein OSSY52_09280 [Tepiditoga spiralis]|uniref:Uncharacterized protein n=1 Tax=Tepiditoga spiralis TaxID=2108365 RepID=A0A7G1G787_9BACT|nr:hypothetical protein [Tepiditoga spiralis]BBE30787.1 hypothetical protein OSSY52_09280 [Tepiditoga spiralis]